MSAAGGGGLEPQLAIPGRADRPSVIGVVAGGAMGSADFARRTRHRMLESPRDVGINVDGAAKRRVARIMPMRPGAAAHAFAPQTPRRRTPPSMRSRSDGVAWNARSERARILSISLSSPVN